MEYMSPREAAKKWGLSERRVQVYCISERIEGATKISGVWLIPKDACKPTDPRRENKAEPKEK